MAQISIFSLIFYSAIFICSFVFSLIINGLLFKFSKTLGIRNTKDTLIRWGSQSKPALGGISFFIIFLFSIIAGTLFLGTGKLQNNVSLLGIIFSVSIGFLMGLFDDAYNTRPRIKFFTQVLCGIILIATGTSISFFDNTYLNWALTIFWVVGMMNSVNMLDNMDAITATVSLFILSTALLLATAHNQLHNINVVFIVGIIGAIAGFLKYNWHPSKMYMGDTGSQFLGVFLAIIGILYMWKSEDSYGHQIPEKQVLWVALIFAIPIIDTTTVFIKRLSKGKSPFVGGKDHTTHHLSYLGLTDRQVVYIFALISSISLFISLFIVDKIAHWQLINTLSVSVYFVLLFLILFIIANKNKHKN